MSIRFDASADNLSRTTLLPSISTFTLMGWFYLSVDRNNYSTFLCFGTTAGAEYQMVTTADGLSLNLWNGSTETAGSALGLGVWNHLTMVVDGTGAGGFRAYLNGALDITTAGNGTATAQRILVGNSPANEFLNGRGAALKFYSRAMSVAEIRAEMFCYQPVSLHRLNAWNPLLHTGDLCDYSGMGGNLTAAGTLATEDGPPRVQWKPPRLEVRRFLPLFVEQAAGGGPTVSPFFFHRHVLSRRG